MVFKDIKNKALFLTCEECESEWDSPEGPIEGVPPSPPRPYDQTRVATMEDIKIGGWDKYKIVPHTTRGPDCCDGEREA